MLMVIILRYGGFTVQVMLFSIDHFTVCCLVARPVNESEAGGDTVLIEINLPAFLMLMMLFSC